MYGTFSGFSKNIFYDKGQVEVIGLCGKVYNDVKLNVKYNNAIYFN